MSNCKHSPYVLKVLGVGFMPADYPYSKQAKQAAVVNLKQQTSLGVTSSTASHQDISLHSTDMDTSMYNNLTPFEIVVEARSKGEVMFMVLELCEGGSLKNLVCRQLTRPDQRLYNWGDRMRWAIEIAEGMADVEKSKIWHKVRTWTCPYICMPLVLLHLYHAPCSRSLYLYPFHAQSKIYNAPLVLSPPPTSTGSQARQYPPHKQVHRRLLLQNRRFRSRLQDPRETRGYLEEGPGRRGRVRRA